MTSGSCAPSSPTRCRWSAAWGTRSTSRWPTSRPTSARRRPPPRPRSWCPDRAEVAAKLATAGRRLAPARSAASSRIRARSPRSAGRSPGSTRSAQLAMARERSGLLLDRATRALGARLARDRSRIPARTALDSAARAGRASHARTRHRNGRARRARPQRTLERGYAIVRRSADGTIVRDPLEAPAGTRLAVRVAAGELPATVDAS